MGEFFPDEKWVVSPTAFPYRSWVILEDGRRVPADDFEIRVGKIYTVESETVPLEDVERLIRPWLARGTIEIVAIGNSEDGLVYVERLTIRADGSAERWRQQFDDSAASDWAATEIETCKTLSFRDVVPGWELNWAASSPESLS
jgi:hypothetical protein